MTGPEVLPSPSEGHDPGDALVLEPMEFLRRLTWRIPDPGSHQVRYQGAYANRSRALYRAADEGTSQKPAAGKNKEPRPKCKASSSAADPEGL